MKIKTVNADSTKELEERVNHWLEKTHDVKIIHIAQSESGDLSAGTWGITLTLVYEQK